MMQGRKHDDNQQSVELLRGSTSLDEMDRLLDEVWRNPFSLLRRSLASPLISERVGPPVDIFEEKGDLVVKMELPGFVREEIQVKLTDDVLTISGEKKESETVEKKNYYKMECSAGSFTRTFHLPTEVESGNAKASFRDGVLELRLPKRKPSEGKVVEIQVK